MPVIYEMNNEHIYVTYEFVHKRLAVENAITTGFKCACERKCWYVGCGSIGHCRAPRPIDIKSYTIQTI